MSIPNEWVSAALVGTARAGLPRVANLTPALAELSRAITDRPDETALLVLAGSADLMARAARLPGRAASVDWVLPAYRPEGDLPSCSPVAGQILEKMIIRQDIALLPEMLDMMAGAGCRAPDELLPQMLHHGARVPRLRHKIVPVIGERGRWLAALNPVWRYAAVDLHDPRSLEAAWTADPGGRAALGRIVRARDAAAARRLIEATWRAEPDAARRELLGVLEAGLSMQDEPFLERALDDRDAQVRRKAADLLAGLPGSRLVERMRANAGNILAYRGGQVQPTFTGAISDEMVRDGVARRDATARLPSPRQSVEWSRLLQQTVGVIPLTHWETRWGLTPAEIIGAALAGKWPRTLLSAFAAAALRQRDARWTDAILAADGYSERTGMLVAALSPETCFARLEHFVEVGNDAVVVVFLRRWPHAWDERRGALLIEFLRRQSAVDPDTRLSPTIRYLSRQFAQRCPPALAAKAGERLLGRRTNGAWEAALRHVVKTLALRREMSEAVNG